MHSVVDAFVWPLKLLSLGGAGTSEAEDQPLPLLSLPNNAIVHHLAPALSPQERGRLSLSCRALSHLLAQSCCELRFDGAQMCSAAKAPRLLQFRNVRKLSLTLHGFHDIGFSAPRLLLHLSSSLAQLEDVVLLDHSADDDYEPLDTPPSTAGAAAGAAAAATAGAGAGGIAAQLASLWQAAGHAAAEPHCEGCGHSYERPDLSCVLISLLALFPRISRLEVFTKLLSDAEIAAVSRFPQLTSLTLNSSDGVMPGSLCSLSSLRDLRELRLGDVDGNNPDDVNTICTLVSQLTSLHMGYCPRLQPPVLRRIRQLHAAVQQFQREQQLEEAAAQQHSALARSARSVAAAVGSAAALLLPGISGGSASSSSSGMPRSMQMLLEAGVPVGGDDSSPESSEASQDGAASSVSTLGAVRSALHAVSAALPATGPSSSSSSTHQPPLHQQHTGAASQAAGGGAPGAAASRAELAPAGASVAPRWAAGERGGASASSRTALEGLRCVTELSVNIDAEEGASILYEMSRLALLEGLMVDSTDEFSVDPGFEPFEQTTNLQRLAITMPMSLANTQSLNRCKQLRELLLCALPTEILGPNSMAQVTRLELLDVAANKPNPSLLQAFPAITHLVIRAGADDATLCMIGACLGTLVHLELYQLAVAYSRTGLRGIAHLKHLHSLVLEVAAPFKAITGGHSSGWGPGLVGSPLGLAIGAVSELSAAAGSVGVPLLGSNPISNPISSFAPPPELRFGVLGVLPNAASSHDWFPALCELDVLGFVAAADGDLPALASLPALQRLSLHLQKPSRGLSGRITLRGLWHLVELSPSLGEIRLSGAMETLLLVPGRVPGVGL